MSLKILVHHIRTTEVFYAGDTFSGIVELHGPFKLTAATLDIWFRGSSRTEQEIDNSRTPSDNAVFFNFSQSLLKDDLNVISGETLTFPYTFRIPRETAEGVEGSKLRVNKRGRYEKSPHPLPPSAAIAGVWTRPWAAYVRYMLEARLKGKNGQRIEYGTITLVPPPTPENTLGAAFELVEVNSKVFTHTSSRLLEENTERRRSVGRWFTDKVSSNSPKAVFHIAAHTTKTFIAGHDIPIRLKLHYISEQSNVPPGHFPKLKLLDLKYKIQAHTDLVSRGFLSPALYISDVHTIFKREIKFAASGLFLVNDEILDIGVLNTESGQQESIKLDQAIVKGFATWNVVRWYSVEISAGFECAGKEMKAVFNWDDVEVVFNEGFAEKPGTQLGGDDTLRGGAMGVGVLAGVVAVAAILTG